MGKRYKEAGGACADRSSPLCLRAEGWRSRLLLLLLPESTAFGPELDGRRKLHPPQDWSRFLPFFLTSSSLDFSHAFAITPTAISLTALSPIRTLHSCSYPTILVDFGVPGFLLRPPSDPSPGRAFRFEAPGFLWRFWLPFCCAPSVRSCFSRWFELRCSCYFLSLPFDERIIVWSCWRDSLGQRVCRWFLRCLWSLENLGR